MDSEEKYEGDGSEKSDASTPEACNPELDEKDAETIKGDAIGSTLYSERFVLSTILRLTKLDRPLSEDEDFEKDLCSLWDMTIEADVIKLLLNHSVLEIFSNTVQNTMDYRLVEILIGTVANMCALKETRDALCSNPDITFPIMETISCFDPLTLIQLMRFFQSALVFENSGDEPLWFQHFEQVPEFVDKFAFILSNSCNANLLVAGFEAINAICTKFSVLDIQDETDTAKDFKEVFVKSSLISSINDAFKQLLFPDPITSEEAATDETNDAEVEEMVSKKKNRIMNLFLDILVILSGFDSISLEAFVDCLPETLDNVARILAALCSPLNLLPLTTNEQGVLENVNELFQSLRDPFHSNCLSRIIHIYSIIEADCREKRAAKSGDAKTTTSEWDAAAEEGENDDVSAEETCVTLLELITRVCMDIEQDQLEGAVRDLGQSHCLSVYNGLNTENRDEDIQICVDKFALALKNIWSVVNGNGDVQL